MSATLAKKPFEFRRSTFFFASVFVGLCWLYFYRFWFPGGDDWAFTAITPGPGITYGVDDFFAALWNDWFNRNGRLADGWLRLLLRPGFDFFKVEASVFLVLLGWTITYALRTATKNRLQLHWAFLAGQLFLPALMLSWSWLTGPILYWAAGFSNYIVPLPGIVLGATLLNLSLSADNRSASKINKGLLLFGSFALILAQISHEQMSWSLGIAAILITTLQFKNLSKQSWFILGAMYLGFAMQMLAPGLWKRRQLYQSALSDFSYEMFIHRIGQNFQIFNSQSLIPWLIIAFSLLIAAVNSDSKITQARLGSGFIGVVALVSTSQIIGHYLKAPLGTRTLYCYAFFAIYGALAIIITRGIISGLNYWGWFPVISTAATMGSAAIPLGTGAIDRAYFVPFFFLGLTAFTMCWHAVWTISSRKAVIALCLVFAQFAMGLAWFLPLQHGMRKNHHFFYTRIEPAFKAAAAGKLQVVKLPKRLPFVNFAYGYALHPRYERAFRNYYGIPDNVKFVSEDWKKIPLPPK